MKQQLNEQFRRMQVLAGIVTEGFLDNIAANIKGKSEQGKLAQEFLNKLGILKNPAELFMLGIEGGGSGPFENEVQDYLFSGGDINTKIPFSKNIKSSSGGAIFKETYTFDFNKDIPTMKSGGKFIWNIKGGKWEPFEKDGGEGKEEPIDIESMKREDDAEPGTFATEASMMTIADVAKIWPDSHPGTPYGYGKRVLDIVKFMEDKKINKMTPEDVKEFENKDKSDTSNQPQPQAESLNQLNEQFRRMQVLAGIITEGQLNESIDQFEDYISGMWDASVSDEMEEGEYFEGVWEKEEYGDEEAYPNAAEFNALSKYLASVGGKATLEGNPDIDLELLPNGDIKFGATVTFD